MFVAAEALGGRGEDRHLVGPGRQRRLEALQVGRQRGVDDARRAARCRPAPAAPSAICGTHRGLTKLVTSIWRRPAAASRSISAIFSAVGIVARLVLQPVARAHLADRITRSAIGGSRVSSSVPSFTCVRPSSAPRRQRRRAGRPAACSIFIASSTTSASPRGHRLAGGGRQGLDQARHRRADVVAAGVLLRPRPPADRPTRATKGRAAVEQCQSSPGQARPKRRDTPSTRQASSPADQRRSTTIPDVVHPRSGPDRATVTASPCGIAPAEQHRAPSTTSADQRAKPGRAGPARSSRPSAASAAMRRSRRRLAPIGQRREMTLDQPGVHAAGGEVRLPRQGGQESRGWSATRRVRVASSAPAQRAERGVAGRARGR